MHPLAFSSISPVRLTSGAGLLARKNAHPLTSSGLSPVGLTSGAGLLARQKVHPLTFSSKAVYYQSA